MILDKILIIIVISLQIKHLWVSDKTYNFKMLLCAYFSILKHFINQLINGVKRHIN